MEETKRRLRLSVKDRKVLERILDNLRRGQAFIMSNETLVCRKKQFKTTTLDLTNDRGEICYSIDKDIGSELTLLHTGISTLKELLT